MTISASWGNKAENLSPPPHPAAPAGPEGYLALGNGLAITAMWKVNKSMVDLTFLSPPSLLPSHLSAILPF